MQNIVLLLVVTSLISCSSSNSIKLAVPEAFKQQATMLHVTGARGNKMSFDNFATSKIKRGIHVSYPGWNRGFFLDNLLLNQVGIQKNEIVRKEKAKFRFTLSDGKNEVEVYADEKELTRKLEYKLVGGTGILSDFQQLQQYQYIFSAAISGDTMHGGKNWELMMSNIYDRRKDTVNSLFTLVKFDDNGLATNGTDTIFIKGLTPKKTEMPNGKTGWLPVKLLSGYELSTADGVVAIIDLIDHNIWFYNELERADKLMIAAISTALFARRVKDAKW